MSRSMNQRFHPRCCIAPDSVMVILYYVTRVLKATVYPRTDLSIFRTSTWWRWIMDNNLPPSVACLMNGTLENYTQFDIKPEDIDRTNVNMDDEAATIMERWLEGWRTQCAPRSYKQHCLTEFRILMPN